MESKPDVPKETGPGESVPLVQSVRRVLTILQAFSVEQPTHTLASLAQMVRLPKSTVRRLLMTLEEEGFVARSETGLEYRLTVKLVRLAGSVHASLEIRKVAMPAMEWVRNQVEDSVFLNMLDGDESVVVERVEGIYPIRNVVEVGKHKPLHLGAGAKVLLAFSADAERFGRVVGSGLQRHTPHTITDPSQLELELERIRNVGYCVAAEDHVVGSTAVSAPVRNHTGRITAALSVAGISPRFGPDRLPDIVAAVTEGARRVSQALGFDQAAFAVGEFTVRS